MSHFTHDLCKMKRTQKKAIGSVILLAAGLALVTIPAHADDLRDFILHNDTSRLITAMQVSTPGDGDWHTVKGDAIPPRSDSRITFRGSGPCVVQLKIQFNGDASQVATWTDGFNLCAATSLHLTHEDDGKYYMRPKYP